MLDMEAIKNFSIDKSDWKKVKFGDVVFEPKESVKDPVAEGIKHVVGLEHISSEDIHLRCSASIEESTTFTKKFSEGDVLFGRRRAYLKKAAKASFEGICSGDITVMRANQEFLISDLLPFIVNNDNFFDHAITHSAGGLSPRVKFKDLANFNLNLPPLNTQERIIELLESNDSLLQSLLNVEKSFSTSKDCAINDYYENGIEDCDTDEWVPVKLEDLCEKIGDGIHKTPKYVEKSDFHFINGNNLINKSIVITEKTKCVSEDEFIKYRKSLSENTLLLSINGTIGNLSFYNKEDVVLGKSVAFITPNLDKLHPQFLYYLLGSQRVNHYFQRELTGSTISNLSLKSIRKLPFRLPPISTQIEIANKAATLEKVLVSISKNKDDFIKVKKSLINKVF